MKQFLGKIFSAEKQVGTSKSRTTWFRGVRTARHQLLPSLFRINLSQDARHKIENEIFADFRSSGHKYLKPTTLTDSWDYLSAMQHFGVKTRLLDWTTDLEVALYFALEGVEKVDIDRPTEWPCIWVLNPFRLNSFFIKEGPVFDRADPIPYDYYDQTVACVRTRAKWPHTAGLAYSPGFSNDRIAAQYGCFTIHGDWSGPLNTAPCMQGTFPTLKRVLIDPNDWGQLRDHSVRKAPSHLRVFPDMHGYVRTLNHKISSKVGAGF